MWFASISAGSERATVALGLGADGAGEHRCSQQVAGDLRGRGLGRGAVWLAVTEGERARDLALAQQWGERVVVAHCQERVLAAVVGHLPTRLRGKAAAELARVWECPEVGVARRELEALAEAWRQEHPGAAIRLLGECGASTATLALGLRGALAQRLRTAAPARYLLQQCLPAARGRSGREWVAAVAMQARHRQEGFRRLPEHAAVEIWFGRLPSVGESGPCSEGIWPPGGRRDPRDGCAPAGHTLRAHQRSTTRWLSTPLGAGILLLWPRFAAARPRAPCRPRLARRRARAFWNGRWPERCPAPWR